MALIALERLVVAAKVPSVGEAARVFDALYGSWDDACAVRKIAAEMPERRRYGWSLVRNRDDVKKE